MTRKPFVAVAVLALTSVSLSAQTKPSIQGVWRIAEATTTGPNAGTNKNPQPSLFIFTAKHYSLMRINSEKPRAVTTFRGQTDKISDAEMIATYREWAPVSANSGTYDIAGSTLTLRPLVAKSTAVMAPKNQIIYSIKVDRDTLTLISATAANGEKAANPSTLRLTRVE